VAINIQLYEQQLEFLLADDHYLAMVAGIGSGKSLVGAVRALLASQGQVGSQRISTPNLGIVTAPTYPLLRDATIRTFLDIAGPAVADFNKSEHLARMRNGSEVLFRSTHDPENLRGPNASWWWGDEAALSTALTPKIMLGRLRQFGKQGYSWLTTTPRGRNWIYQRFIQQPGRDTRLIKAATWQNPFLDEDFIRSLMEEYSGDFARQELEGAFVAFEGLIYALFSRESHVTNRAYQPGQFKYLVGGIDHGFANPGVMLIGGVDGDGRITVVHEEYVRRRRIEEWVTVGQQLNQIWNVRTWFADPSEPDYIRQYREAGLNVVPADNTVNAGIQGVQNRLVVRADGAPRLQLTAAAAYCASEFEQYQWLENAQGVKDQPRKANDHALDALRYLVRGVDLEMGQTRFEVTASRYAG
jgi:PBSX family phage terminase large subunit